ncbi:MAG: HNH endonuclease [Bacteroidetes bacterium]|nr:HNH endonuclease [Bacteroidota bacterium]
MSSAKEKLLKKLLDNVGKTLTRELLSKTANVHDWQRSLRTLRQEGWQIVSSKEGYTLVSELKNETKKSRITINNKLRYSILQRDNSTCQRCGKTVQDGIKLEVDHKIPVEWNGTNDVENLWTLCNECNGGKKHFFSDFDDKIMREVMNEKSGYQRLVKLFKLSPNTVIEPIKLEAISGIRDWTRTIRLIRSKEKLNLVWIDKSTEFPQGGYKLIRQKN